MPPSLPRVAPALALVVLIGLVVLVKWCLRGPGPLEFRDVVDPPEPEPD